LLLIALIGPGLVQPDLARADHIGCGSTLGPGGKHVLDRDLTCSTAEDGPHWGLFVADGATLNMNGHTVTCANSGRGILVIDAKLMISLGTRTSGCNSMRTGQLK
jgi:hypothetical protein